MQFSTVVSEFRVGVASVCMALLLCASASAQDTTSVRPPYRGLFGSAPPASRSLDVRWSALGVYDDNVTSDTASFDPRSQVGGVYGMGVGVLTYATNGDRRQFTVNGRTTTRYYVDLSDLSATDGSGDVSFTTKTGRNGKVTLFQSVMYQPYYQVNLLGVSAPSEPDVVPPELTDTPMQALPSYILDGRIGWGTSIGRHGTFAAEYSYRHTTFDGRRLPFDWQLADVKFSRQMTRYASLRLGYGYGQARSGTKVENHNIDLGIDYARPISHSRRTRVNFSSGSSVVNYLNQRFYVMTGDAGITRDIGRSWGSNFTYRRGVQYVEGIIGPVIADSIRANAGGFLGRRLETNFYGAYSSGQIGLGVRDSGYTSYSAGASLRYALTRLFSADLQYLYDQYDFAQSAPLLVGVPRSLERQSIRIGITGWIPLIHRVTDRN